MSPEKRETPQPARIDRPVRPADPQPIPARAEDRRPAANPPTPRKSERDAPAAISPEERRTRIAERAYYKALDRGFGGGEVERDWLEAEREIDDELLRGRSSNP